VLGCWLVGTRLEERYDAVFLNLERLHAQPSSVPTVVLIGSSKTRCAIEFDSDMSARLNALGSPARFIRVTQSHATLRDFRQLFEALPRVRPRAVLIESDLVTLEPNAYRIREASQYRGWRERVRHGLGALISPDLISGRRPENRDRSWWGCGYPTDPATARARREVLTERRASTPAERAPFLDLARELKREGTYVALLDLPGRNDAIGRKPAAFLEAEERATKEVLATHLVDRFDGALALPSDNFQDEAHLNERGRARASAWLARELVPILNEKSPQ
jgi:hypothetical protein